MKRLLCCWLLVLASSVNAALVQDLYSARAPVVDMSTKARDQAAGQALARVFVKVSGSDAVLRHEAVQEALKQAGSHLMQYAYHSRSAGSRELEAVFDDKWVNSIIAAANAPLWTANRPAVLTWLVLEQGGERDFVDDGDRREQLIGLKKAFSQRGLPLQLPLMDLQDSAALSTEQAWRFNDSVLRQASARYGVDDILVGRFNQQASGQWVGDWAYLSQKGRSERRVRGDSFEEVASLGAAQVAQALSSRYAVTLTEAGAGAVTLHVSGIHRYADYAKVVQLLERIELIEQVNVRRVFEDVVTLSLSTQATARQLTSLIELNRQLMPMAGASVEGELSYQWTN